MEAETTQIATTDSSETSQALVGTASFMNMLARMYFSPLSDEQVEKLAGLDFAALAGVNELIDDGANDMRRYLAKRNSGTRRELAVDYTGSIGGMRSYEERVAIPYESVFASDSGLLFQEQYHEVYHLFRQNGVKPAEGCDYPDDHLTFMMEFVAMMLCRAAEELDRGECNQAAADLELCNSFISKHILSWYDDFAELANKFIETRFYRGLLKLTKGYLQYTCELIAEVTEDQIPA